MAAIDQEFMNRFLPRIQDVLLRDETHWRNHSYEVKIPSTRMCNLGYVLDGSGELEVNDARLELRKGCFYQISPPGSRLRFASSREHPLLYIAVHFEYRLLHWEGKEVSLREASSALPIAHAIMLDSIAMAEQGFRELLQMWNQKQPGFEWRSRLLLMDILDGIERMRTDQSMAVKRAAEAIRRIMEEVHIHHREPPDRERMAKKCSMSVNHFSMLFKKISGYSYVNYVNKVRIDRAKVLLRSGTDTIAEIAAEIGYSDPLYFSRLFSREVGISPREYRGG